VSLSELVNKTGKDVQLGTETEQYSQTLKLVTMGLPIVLLFCYKVKTLNNFVSLAELTIGTYFKHVGSH